MSGFVIGTSTLVDTETASTTNYLRTDTKEVSSTDIRNDIGSQKSNLGLFKFSSKYKPSATFQFDYDAFAKISAQRENNELNRQVADYILGTNTNEDIFTSKNKTRLA